MSRARSESSARRLSREVASIDACCSRAVVADTSPKRTPARSSTISLPRLTASLRFPGQAPAASLLHADRWSGNAGLLADGSPVLFDPAVYWGDREADLAMTELFGGFPQDFYSAYAEAAPLAPGYAVRKTLYNLYHVLNHANLFGGGYAAQAERMIERLLAEVR